MVYIGIMLKNNWTKTKVLIKQWNEWDMKDTTMEIKMKTAMK